MPVIIRSPALRALLPFHLRQELLRFGRSHADVVTLLEICRVGGYGSAVEIERNPHGGTSLPSF